MLRFNLNRILKYLVAASIITIPLYPKFPFLTIPGTYVAVRLEDFLLMILAIVTFIKILPNLGEYLKNKIVVSLILFIAAGLVSYLFGVFLTKTVVAHIGILHWLRRIEYFIPFFAGWVALKEEKNPRETLEFFVKCLMITVFVAFIYGFGQKYFGWPVIITQNEEYSKGIALRWIPGSHINSTFAGHYDMASYLVIVMPIFIAMFFEVKGIKSKALIMTVILSGIWLLINAISRISIVSYLLSATLSLLLIKKYKAIPIVLIVSIILFAGSSDLIARYLRIIQVTIMDVSRTKINYVLPRFEAYAANEATVVTLQEKATTETPSPTPIPVFEDRSTSIRLNIEWPRAIRAFTKDPPLGTGYSSINLATDNDFLRLLGEVGFIGFAAFLLIFARVVVTFVRKIPLDKHFAGIEKAFMAGAIAAIPGAFLNSAFIDVFEASKFMTAFLLIIGIAVYLAESRVNE